MGLSLFYKHGREGKQAFGAFAAELAARATQTIQIFLLKLNCR
jgi:hypothetical protein